MVSRNPMREELNSESAEPTAPPFRWNSRVLQMAALVMLALALPLTIAILGIRDIRMASKAAISAPEPEVPGLRGALETIVDSRWKPPLLDGSVRTARRGVPDGDACLRTGEAVQRLARDSGGTVLAPERIESGGTRWLVQMPVDRKNAFEAGLEALGFAPAVGEASGDAVFYAVEIRIGP